MLGMLAGTAGAAEYQEQGNAGDVPGTAQSTAGPVPTPLDAITGEISDDMDQDMFKIVVTDPVTFSASTNNPETVPSDTMLYLFDATGHGVLATDDIDGFLLDQILEVLRRLRPRERVGAVGCDGGDRG